MMKERKGIVLSVKPRHPAIVIAGIAIAIFAVFLDAFGLGRPGSFGIGQGLLLTLGGVVASLGQLGVHRFVVLYRDAAVVLLNTLLVIGLIELAAIVVSRGTEDAYADIMSLPYYRDKIWAPEYFYEASAAENFRYRPYVVWGHRPFQGEMLTLDENGFRVTPGSDCTPGAYRLFMFGGSTALGFGSPDWGTIPAYIQESLPGMRGRAVCVENFGQSGYVSTQGVLLLVLQLQKGNIPDGVVFYDGVNEVQAAYESGEAGGHVNMAIIAERLEEGEGVLERLIKGSRAYAVLRRWRMAFTEDEAGDARTVFNYEFVGVDASALADAVVAAYLGNYQAVGQLSAAYGFDYDFVWQPHLAVDPKTLTADEQRIRSGMNASVIRLAGEIYRRVASAAESHGHLWSMQDVLIDETAQVWIDDGGHVTPEGNRIIGREIAAVLRLSSS